MARNFLVIFILLSGDEHFLRGMICDHLSDTYVPGTNGHTSIGNKTLTTSGAGFPVRDRLNFHSPLWVRLAHTGSRVFFCISLLGYYVVFVVITHQQLIFFQFIVIHLHRYIILNNKY